MITLTVNSTHFYLIECRSGMLLVDAGWELARFTAQLKFHKAPITDIKYVMFTHNHPDHAGLVQEIKELSGAKLIVHKVQLPFLDKGRTYSAELGSQKTIRVESGDLISPNRDVLQSIGIQGEIVETPGHTEDSISLVLDQGDAFIGDLPAPELTGEEQIEVVRASWRKLLALNVRTFYHSHAGAIPANRIHI